MNSLIIKEPTKLAEIFKDICNQNKKNNTIHYINFLENQKRKEFTLSNEDIAILIDTIDNYIKMDSLTEQLITFYSTNEPIYYNTYLSIDKNKNLIVTGTDFKGENHSFLYKDFHLKDPDQYLVISERNNISALWFQQIIK